MLVSTGGGEKVAGVFIVDPTGVIKQALTGNGISFDDTSPFTIGDDNAYIMFQPPYNNSFNNDEKSHILIRAVDGGTVSIDGSVIMGGTGSNKTLSQVLEDLGQAITTIEYGKSSSSTSHSDVPIWSTSAPE